MAKSPLILAALAKAAVPHLNFHEVKSLSTSTSGAFDTALLTATSGEHYLIRIANRHFLNQSLQRDKDHTKMPKDL